MKAGFTLIEILLVMAILAILSSGVFMWLGEYRNATEVDSASKSMVSALRTAQSFSVSGKDSKSWGVYFDGINNKFIFFRNEEDGFDGTGPNLVTEKEENILSSFVKLSNISLNNNGANKGVVFSKTKGATAQNGTIQIEGATNGNICKKIEISPSGMISMQLCP
jgi:prepilin-type N-terminal cleavage/methylation domain-containing protein